MSRELPGHIRALLDAAGGPADSAGIPWAGRNLGPEAAALSTHADDDGSADVRVNAALDELRAGRAGEDAVVDGVSLQEQGDNVRWQVELKSGGQDLDYLVNANTGSIQPKD